MTDSEKMELIADSVDMEVDEISPDTILEELDNWDSVAVLAIISVFNDKFGKFPSAKEILSHKTVGELMESMN